MRAVGMRGDPRRYLDRPVKELRRADTHGEM